MHPPTGHGAGEPSKTYAAGSGRPRKPPLGERSRTGQDHGQDSGIVTRLDFGAALNFFSDLKFYNCIWRFGRLAHHDFNHESNGLTFVLGQRMIDE